MLQKFFNILITNLNIPHNYFDNPTKLFPDLYLAKFLDQQNYSFRVLNHKEDY